MSFSIEIASVPDREAWVAEIWFDKDLIAEISQEDKSNPKIEFYIKNDGNFTFNLIDFFEVVLEASKKLGVIIEK